MMKKIFLVFLLSVESVHAPRDPDRLAPSPRTASLNNRNTLTASPTNKLSLSLSSLVWRVLFLPLAGWRQFSRNDGQNGGRRARCSRND